MEMGNKEELEKARKRYYRLNKIQNILAITDVVLVMLVVLDVILNISEKMVIAGLLLFIPMLIIVGIMRFLNIKRNAAMRDFYVLANDNITNKCLREEIGDFFISDDKNIKANDIFKYQMITEGDKQQILGNVQAKYNGVKYKVISLRCYVETYLRRKNVTIRTLERMKKRGEETVSLSKIYSFEAPKYKDDIIIIYRKNFKKKKFSYGLDGAKDIVTGNSEFDRLFFVRCGNPEKAKKILTEDKLKCLVNLAENNKPFGVFIGFGEVAFIFKTLKAGYQVPFNKTIDYIKERQNILDYYNNYTKVIDIFCQ